MHEPFLLKDSVTCFLQITCRSQQLMGFWF